MLQGKSANPRSVEEGRDPAGAPAGKTTRSQGGGGAASAGHAVGASSQDGRGARMADWSADSMMSAMGLGAPELGANESPHGGASEGSQLEDPSAAGAGTTLEVQTTLAGKGTGTPETREGSAAPAVEEGGKEIPANAIVAPGGAPAVSAGANDCLPSTGSAVVTWNVVDDGANWRADVASLALAGRIRINPWPSSPTSITVPNTPNPVVGGNINNTAGSSNHWQSAIDDMADYDTAGGGAGPNWHSTAASSAHEWAHWNQDYVGDAVTSATGGNWAAVNARIDALTVPKAAHADAAAARVALTPLVDREIAAWRRATIARWNALIGGTDTPGAGGRGYAAGAAVLATQIAAVRAFKTAQGW
jgi:hypothetical protein